MRCELNGVSYKVEVHARGTGDHLLLLHYFGGSSQSWREVIEGVGTARCVAPDLRGFGESGAPPIGYSVDDYADDLEALIRLLALERFTVVGHSMGGKIALALAARRPAGLRALVLVAPSPPTPEPMEEEEREQLLQTHGQRQAALDTIRKITFRPLPQPQLERSISDTLRSSPAGWRAWLEHGSLEDISDRMAQIDVPVSIIAGEHDPVISRALIEQEVVPYLSGTAPRVDILPKLGHLVPLEAPQVLASKLAVML